MYQNINKCIFRHEFKGFFENFEIMLYFVNFSGNIKNVDYYFTVPEKVVHLEEMFLELLSGDIFKGEAEVSHEIVFALGDAGSISNFTGIFGRTVSKYNRLH